MRVLIVEDDEVLKDGLEVGLRLSGLVVDAVSTCADADAAIACNAYDAIILDVMLPDGSGLTLLKKLRARRNTVPVLLLTAKDSIADRVSGLDLGADDYLGKPFDLDEVAARLRALQRRAAGRPTSSLQWADITLNPALLLVEKSGQEVRLSRREFSILRALMDRPGVVLSKAQIEEKLYSWQEEIESNVIEVHVHHLRNKLGVDVIETIRGVGYRMGTPR